jgi:hypothetical protein
MVYKDDPEEKYWRVCELIIEEWKNGENIKRGKIVEHNGDTTQITGGWLGYCDGVAIEGWLETEKGDVIVETGGIEDGDGNKRWMVLTLSTGTVDALVLEDLELDRQMFSMETLTAQSVRNFLARHRVSVDRAFPNMTVDQQ